MGKLLNAIMGLPATPTGYVPDIPYEVTNIGIAYWRFSPDAAGARVFAPKYPPWSWLWFPLAATLAVAAGAIAGFLRPDALGGHAKTIAIVLLVPGPMGLIVLWIAILMGNLEESSDGDLVHCDAATGQVTLPRAGLAFARSDVRRLELACFVLDTPGSARRTTVRLTDLVLVRAGADGKDRYELVLRTGSGRAQVGESLAAYLRVPLVRTMAGRYNWATKKRID